MTPAMTAHRAQLAQELRDEEAARRWSEGKLNAEQVQQMTLYYADAAEQVRTWWGKYPTWEQLVELAQLCGVEPLWFTSI